MQPTTRTCVPEADALLGQEMKVLDHGFVVPVDYMGGDSDVVQAARASYGPSGRSIQDDRGLLRYLMRHRHTTPFEMCEVKFLYRAPIFVARQWIRHRTANVNEMSLRYSEPLEFFYVPDPSTVSVQAKDNKQGRGVPLDGAAAEQALDLFRDGQREDLARYQRLAGDLGIARELARTVLPVSLYTQWIWKIDLHNLLHFLDLRLDPHAQLEIRVFAEAMAAFVQAWCPLAWEAFEEYRLRAATFGASELRALRLMLRRGYIEPRAAGLAAGLRGRELDEFCAKVAAHLPSDREGLPTLAD